MNNYRFSPVHMRTKAQVQMGETIAVLIVFFFLIAIGAAFYVKIAKSNLEATRDELAQLESINVMKRVLSLPELHCSKNNIVRESCIDTFKLQVAQSATSPLKTDELAYFDLFGYSTISIQEHYPESATTSTAITIYDNPLAKFRNKLPSRIPVSLYDPVDDTYKFGVLEINTYT